MGRRPRAAAVSGDMRHEALPHGAGTRVPNQASMSMRTTLTHGAGTRASRDVAGNSGRAAVARPAGGRRRDREGKRAYGPTEGRIPARRLTERRILRPPRRAECAFPSHHRPGGVGLNPPPGCGGVAPGTRRPWAGARPHGKAQSVFWFNKNCAVPIWEQDGLPCTIHLHDVVAISSRHTKTGMQATRGEQRAGRVVAAQAPTT